MSPDGAIVGAIGAVVAVIGKVNGYDWKSSLAILLGGFTLCGYLMPALHEVWPLKPGTLYFALFICGFVSSHVYKFIDKQAPVLLAMLFQIANKYLKK